MDTSISNIMDGFDLQKYISRYEGYTRITRLLHVCECDPSLKTTSQILLLDELKKGYNIGLYLKISESLRNVQEITSLDNTWPSKASEECERKREQIESDLLKARSALGNESMRIKLNDLAKLRCLEGNLMEAFKIYHKVKEYCSLPIHRIEVSIDLIILALDMKNYPYIHKVYDDMSKMIIYANHDDKISLSVLKAAMGISYLNANQYTQAATAFLEIEPNAKAYITRLLSCEDVAVYGTLCLLATQDRKQIRTALENTKFKAFQEYVPTTRKCLLDYVSGQYKSCLDYLSTLCSELRYDIYMSSLYPALCRTIQQNCILQYFNAYECIHLSQMANDLGLPEDLLEQSLVTLIQDKRIIAKIDSTHHTVHRYQPEALSHTLHHMKEISIQLQQELNRSIRHLSMKRHNFMITPESNDYRRGPVLAYESIVPTNNRGVIDVDTALTTNPSSETVTMEIEVSRDIQTPLASLQAMTMNTHTATATTAVAAAVIVVEEEIEERGGPDTDTGIAAVDSSDLDDIEDKDDSDVDMQI